MNDESLNTSAARLGRTLSEIESIAVALSGGIDSLVLTAFASRLFWDGKLVRLQVFHAVSPAVPEEATERVRFLSRKHGWPVEIINAGEFEDARYVANPVDRCFYCKTSLYGCISQLTNATIVSGTHMDDMSDYRPGLKAAESFSVRHPYVEARIAKATVRRLAERYGLADFENLPAAPCLSSRVETGIQIDAEDLRSINQIELFLSDMLPLQTVRCRLRANQVTIEVDQSALSVVKTLPGIDLKIRAFLTNRYSLFPIQFAAYKMGSAFLRKD